MESASRYKVDNEINEGFYSVIYAGTCLQDGKSVVLKTLRREFLSTERIGHFKKEFEITKVFKGSAGIIQTFGIESLESSLAIVLEDFGAKSLNAYLKEQVPDLDQALQIGISIASALSEIHAHQLMHKDINPRNILYNPKINCAKIIDFGIASRVTRENPSVEINELVGTLPYISPEQTGRMNRLVDYRTDLYSFGATLYEILTGRPPFQASDPMEIVHCHIARQPVRVDAINPDLPASLGDIVAKLLSKTPEERYQTAEGVRADLEHCLQQIRSRGIVKRFPLGRRDFCDRLLLGQKLYGRSREINRLYLEFERVLSNQNVLVLISGTSGVGKTALVNEVHKPMTESRGFFVSSKFDQFDRNTPYMAIVNAFNQLARQLLTQSDEQVREWRKRLTQALRENSGIITDTIPDMALIMGPQAQVDTLPPVETKNRFQVIFQKFVGVLATEEHPVVLFLDDLQWADLASLEVIEYLMTSTDQSSLYIIGAYRNNEVDLGDPLALLIEDLRNSTRAVIAEMVLSPLSPQDVNQLIADTLSTSEEATVELAELIYNKTLGNPFFVNQLLESFYTEGLLFFDKSKSKWQWQFESIYEYGFTDNVIDLLVSKIEKLSPSCQEILRLSACIGTVFSTDLLVALQTKNKESLEEDLEEAIAVGLVQKVAVTAPLLPSNRSSNEKRSGREYRFIHDRILQAVYTNIPRRKRLENHRVIGLALLEQLENQTEDQLLFQAVLHLNLSREKIESRKEKQRLARLNLEAGKKAMLSAANRSALEYLETGISLLDEDCWQSDYRLSLALHEEAAEAAHLTTDRERVEQLTNAIFQHTINIIDEVKATEIKILSLFSMDRNVEVTHFGIGFLRKLGLRIPLNPGKLSLVTALLRAKLSLIGKNDEALLEVGPMTDETKLASMRILSAMSLSAYTTNKNLYAYFVLTQVRLIASWGHSIYSPSTFCSYGLILCGKLGDIEQGNRFGKLALLLLEKYFERSRLCRVQAIANGFIFPHKKSLLETGSALQKTYRLGFDSGDFQYGAMAIGFYIDQALAFGITELGKLEDETRTYISAIKNMKQSFWWLFVSPHLHLVLNFVDDVPDFLVLDGEEGKETSLLEMAKQNKNETCEWVVYAGKTMLHCYYSEFESGIPWARRSRALYHSGTGTPCVYMAMFWEGLIYLRGTKDWRADEGKERAGLLKEIRAELSKSADHAPENFLYMVKLIDAERYRLRGKDNLASDCYDEAIELAANCRHVNAEALGNELAADFYVAKGKNTIARSYAENARFAYLRWGARAKVKHLENKFSGLLPKTTIGAAKEHKASVHETTKGSLSLDFRSIIKAARGISKEIILERLLDILIRTATENAGAEKGFLLMKEDAGLRIEAGCLYDKDQLVTLGTGNLDERQDISQAVVRFVARSQTPIVIGDATREGDFTSDAYVKQNQIKSILCIPIIHSGNLTGILYFENNNTKHAFTKEQLEVLEVISSQAAVSLRNARLYQELSTSKELLQTALEKAQESDRMKDSFLARTGHELRTPLNAIINIPEWVVDGIKRHPGAVCIQCKTEFTIEEDENILDIPKCPECGTSGSLKETTIYFSENSLGEIDRNLRNVIDSGKNLSAIVEDILNFSDLQLGKTSLELEDVNIDRLFLDVRNKFFEETSARSLKIVSKNDSSYPTIRVDKKKMQQVLSILVKNAIQFSPDGEEIQLRAVSEQIATVLSVRDRGPGIDKEDTALIFQSFRQAHEDSTRHHGGTGLGLAIAKNIVELHGGKIWVDSEIGKGSTFFLRLPTAIRT